MHHDAFLGIGGAAELYSLGESDWEHTSGALYNIYPELLYISLVKSIYF